MTLIVLTVLAAAWLGYFAMWLRDKRASRLLRGDVSTSHYFDATGRERVSLASVGNGARNLDGARNMGDLLESPRTRQQALRRRQHVAAVLIAVALASLLAVPAFGPTALAVHVMVDVALILFAFGSLNRQQAPDVNMADVRMLYPDRSAPRDAVAMPLRRVANG